MRSIKLMILLFVIKTHSYLLILHPRIFNPQLSAAATVKGGGDINNDNKCLESSKRNIPPKRLLEDKAIFVAGVSDNKGYGWGIAKCCAFHGAKILVGTWVPMVNIFESKFRKGYYDADRKLQDGRLLEIEKIYPLDVQFDNASDIPHNLMRDRRYKNHQHFSIEETAKQIHSEHGFIDGVVHCIANAPEINHRLVDTSRQCYLSAVATSSYSFVSMASKFSTIINKGGSIVTLTYHGSRRVMPGYGGGISSSKAALESDTKYLSYELGREFNVRVNAISAGPLMSRAGNSIGRDGKFVEHAQLETSVRSPLRGLASVDDVGSVAAFLLSPLAKAITGSIIFCDNGFHTVF